MAVALAAAAGLTACSSEPETTAAAQGTSNDTLATVLAQTEGFGTASRALGETGLAPIFDGPGTYTLLAPSDEAFAGLGDAAEPLMAEDQRAVLVALLRNHIVPGQIDVASVRSAIEAKDGPVRMRTLGGGTVSFSLDGENLIVSGEGQQAGIDTAGEVIASNGAMLPIDAVLVRPPAPAQ
jgi:uncharacterized surface protein with fasciclin (FAS1) repeats